MEGGEVSPFGSGKLLHDQLHPLFVDGPSKIRISFASRGSRHHIRAFHLPADIGGAVERLGRQWRTRKEIVHAVVEPHGVLCGVAASAAAAGLVFGVGGLAEDDLVAVWS